MYTSYEDACEATVTRGEAESEILRHGASFIDFVDDCGAREEYSGKTVLDWVGY